MSLFLNLLGLALNNLDFNKDCNKTVIKNRKKLGVLCLKIINNCGSQRKQKHYAEKKSNLYIPYFKNSVSFLTILVFKSTRLRQSF